MCTSREQQVFPAKVEPAHKGRVMFRSNAPRTRARTALGMLELIFHATVRSIRVTNRNAVWGLLLNIFQTVLLIAVMYFVMDLLGARGMAIRGDFMLYVMSGVFMFMTHTKAMGAVAKADGPTSAMMMHAPMNTIVSITSSALGALYLQTLSAAVVMYIYHVTYEPITIHQPVGMMGMFLLSWISGVAIGMVFKAATPWAPEFFGIAQQIYSRANMIASGKMFVANAMPTYILAYFDWNPLFHTIDQGRGYIFLNYDPRYSSVEYPMIVVAACMMIGLMGEFYTRKHASASWGAGK
jgi:ABC-type polysaccharide/polyol phosphate export permease